MKFKALFCVLLIAGSLAGVALAEDKIDGAELKKFQGTWVMTSAEMDGKKVHDAHVKVSKITFVGTAVEVLSPHQGKEKIVAKVTKLDPSTKPAQIHWIRSAGPKAGATMMAIYEFTGPDQYKVCFDPAGQGAPDKFATKAGSGHIWHNWKRVKK